MSFDTDALAVWINGLFVLAAVAGLLAIAGLVILLATARPTGRPPVRHSAQRLPEPALSRPEAATSRAA